MCAYAKQGEDGSTKSWGLKISLLSTPKKLLPSSAAPQKHQPGGQRPNTASPPQLFHCNIKPHFLDGNTVIRGFFLAPVLGVLAI